MCACMCVCAYRCTCVCVCMYMWCWTRNPRICVWQTWSDTSHPPNISDRAEFDQQFLIGSPSWQDCCVTGLYILKVCFSVLHAGDEWRTLAEPAAHLKAPPNRHTVREVLRQRWAAGRFHRPRGPCAERTGYGADAHPICIMLVEYFHLSFLRDNLNMMVEDGVGLGFC